MRDMRDMPGFPMAGGNINPLSITGDKHHMSQFSMANRQHPPNLEDKIRAQRGSPSFNVALEDALEAAARCKRGNEKCPMNGGLIGKSLINDPFSSQPCLVTGG